MTTATETAKTTYPCPNCQADLLTAGFVVRKTRYQAYVRTAGQLLRSYNAKSNVETAHCLPCGEPLNFTGAELRKAAA